MRIRITRDGLEVGRVLRIETRLIRLSGGFGIGWSGRRRIGLWFGADVPNDLWDFVLASGIDFVLNGGESTEKLIGDVCHDGGAACGDFVFREEDDEAGEEVVDFERGEEVLNGVDEFGGQVFGCGDVFREMGVTVAEGEVRVRTVEAAAGAVLKLMLAAGCFVDRLGVSDCWFHFGPR
jgi:hypothetical protein